MTIPFQRLFISIHRPAALVAALVVSAVPVARATDLTVCAQGCEFKTIQGAVDSAHHGDVIQIGPGTYLENVKVDKSVTLNGAGRDKTRVDGRSLGPVLTLDSGNATDVPVLVTNMTITHGRGVGIGGGVEVSGAIRLDMRFCILVSNRSDGEGNGAGGGINLESFPTSPNKISDTILVYNHSHSGGGAITVSFESSAAISSTTISQNDTAGSGGGILLLNKSGATIKNTTVTQNRAAFDGGGLNVAFGSRLNPGAFVSVDGSIIADNSSGQNGGGISGPTDTLSNTVVARNHAAVDGGGLFTGRESQLKNVFVVQNTAAHDAGGILTSGQLSLTNTTIAQNQPDNCKEVPPNGTGCP